MSKQVGGSTTSQSWPRCGATPPCFFATRRDGRVLAQGEASCELGHRLGDERGVYARWSWDGETLTAEVDPLGYFSLFVFASGGSVAVSPSILALIAAGADTTIDRRALSVFHRMGLFIGEDTPFEHVRVLPPGGRLRWSHGELTISGAPRVPRERLITRRDAVDAFVTATRASIARILDAWSGEVLLPLSGGRDSRHILLEMAHQGRPPDACVTFHHEGETLNAEARAARAVCQRLGVPHVVLGHPRPRTRDVARALLLTSLSSDEHAQMMPLHDFYLSRQAAALDGIAGDILSNPDDWAGDFFGRAARGDFAGIARRMMDGHAAVLAGPRGRVRERPRDDETVDYVAATIARFADAPDPYQAFWFWNRTRREIGFVPTAILGSAQAVFCPYLDPELVELGLSLPFAITRDQKLHDDALAKAYPACRDVPFQEGFVDPPRRRRPLRKLRAVVEASSTLLALAPDRPLRELLTHLRGSRGLSRGAGEIYRLHALCLEGLDAARAKRLLALGAELESSRPTELVTETFLPRGLLAQRKAA